MKRRRIRRGPLESERAEIDAFVERQVSIAGAFMAYVGLSGRQVSAESREVAEYLKASRFWEGVGRVTLLMETERASLKLCRPLGREQVVEEIERRFEAYHRALKEGGYL